MMIQRAKSRLRLWAVRPRRPTGALGCSWEHVSSCGRCISHLQVICKSGYTPANFHPTSKLLTYQQTLHPAGEHPPHWQTSSHRWQTSNPPANFWPQQARAPSHPTSKLLPTSEIPPHQQTSFPPAGLIRTYKFDGRTCESLRTWDDL